MAVAPAVASIASAIYLLTLIVVPLAAPERDVFTAHPEHYADTTLGALVRIGYLAVTATLGAVVAIVSRMHGRWRFVAATFALAAAIATADLAIAPAEVTGGPLLVGVIALALTPGTAGVAIGSALPVPARVFGLAVTVAFIAIAIGPKDVAGLTNRLWDVLLATWGIVLGLTFERGR